MSTPEADGKNMDATPRSRRPKPGEELELHIDSLAFGGPGVARHNGVVVLVRGGLPGDTVRARVRRRKKQHVEAYVVELLEPGPNRIEPRCEHFGQCGGCSWQHLEYEAQLDAKTQHVRDHFERIGGFADPPLSPIIGMDDPWRYRNKMEYAFGEFGDGRLKLGLHAAGRYDLIIDVDDCHLQPQVCNELRNAVRHIGREVGWDAYRPRRHQGDMRHFVIRTAQRGERLMGIFCTLEDNLPDAVSMAQALGDRFPQLHSVLWYVNNARGGQAVAGQGAVLYGADHLQDTVLGLTFEVSANSFMQTNTFQRERLYSVLLDALEFDGSETAFDLYTGTGAIALLLSGRAQRVVGIESVPEAVADAQHNAEANGISNTEFICGEVEKIFQDMVREQSTDVLVIDPPRAGMHKKALAAAIAAAPRRIGYVSCNPSTLARDAAALTEAGYTLHSVQPVDMFPHTYHIECVAVFSR